MNRPLGPTPWRWAIRTLPPCLVLVAPIAGGAPVWALHAAPPVARIEERQAGPYHIVVHLSPDPARVTKPLQVLVSGRTLTRATVTLIGQPALGTNAMALRPIRLNEDVNDPGQYAAPITFEIVGAWELDLRVEGARGSGRTLVPIIVASSPSALPLWLGWAIGLSPLLGLAWFSWWNWCRYASRPAVHGGKALVRP